MGNPLVNRTSHHIEVTADRTLKRVTTLHTGLNLDEADTAYDADAVNQLVDHAKGMIANNFADAVNVVQDPEGFRL